jgi:hypothetical protein
MSAAAAAKARMNRASTIVGTVTRTMPGSTEAAHALAAASMTVIAENSRKALQQRQMSQLRAFYDSGGKYDKSGDSQSESGSDSGSESSNDSDEGSVAVRPAEISSARAHSQLAPAQQALAKLSEELHCQRRFLKPSEVDEFDTQWGLDPTGEFTQGDRSLVPCVKGKAGAEALILAELQYVKTETAKKIEKLNIATDAHTGLEILHLFIKDLLGRDTPAAIIFETKSAEDFKHTKVVTRTAKRLAMAALVGINFFFVYYAMLTGYRKGISWQRMYLLACIVQFIVEILLFETMECVWINCAIPVLVSDEVRRVGDSITEVVRNLCANVETDSKLFLNAPNYLFVSTNVAKKFPDLMESILVQAYTTHLPGELARKWQVGSVARAQRYQRLRRVTLLGSVMAALQYLGTAPFVMQRLFIRFVQPFAFSALVLMWKLIISDTVYIIVAVVVLVAAIAYGVYKYNIDRANDHVKQVTPIEAQYQTQDMAVVTVVDNSFDGGSLNMPSPHITARKHRNAVGDTASSRASSNSSKASDEKKTEEKDSHSELSSIVSTTVERRATKLLQKKKMTSRSSQNSLSDVSSVDLSVSAPASPRGLRAIGGSLLSKVPYYHSSGSSDSASNIDDSEVSLQASGVVKSAARSMAESALDAHEEASVDIDFSVSSETISSDSSHGHGDAVHAVNKTFAEAM